MGSEWWKNGCCRICGLPIGICKHIREDTRGSMGLCANSFWLWDNTCARHPHQLVLHLWDSPNHQVILQCWYVKDQDVLGH
ncbi:unnamed protein product [Staurois parvus]|uniref:Uncharacterized protein n=1 Tax=Staurois parvus TaxID=386267 RepID=A0ABN9FBE6_9NEOB|nr:unnamed protein product [Staurois parvus]